MDKLNEDKLKTVSINLKIFCDAADNDVVKRYFMMN